MPGGYIRSMKTYYLDPDYRKMSDTSKPFCVRCQKEIKDPSKAVKVTLIADGFHVREGGSDLIGKNCWKFVKKMDMIDYLVNVHDQANDHELDYDSNVMKLKYCRLNSKQLKKEYDEIKSYLEGARK